MSVLGTIMKLAVVIVKKYQRCQRNKGCIWKRRKA